jgi:hypothetical protein
LLLAVVATACASMADVIAEHQRGGGTGRVYPLPYDAAWSVSISALRAVGTDAIEEHRAEGYMLTSTGQDIFGSSGTVIGVWLQPQSSTQTLVSVVTKRKQQTALTTGLTEGGFHEQFERAWSRVPPAAPPPGAPPPYAPAGYPPAPAPPAPSP